MIPQQTRLPTPPETEPSTPSSKKRSRSACGNTERPPLKKRKSDVHTEEFCSSQTSTLSSGSSSSLKGEDLFHARVFHGAATTTMFYQFIASLRTSIMNDVKTTSETHKFIRALRDGGRLIRCYTQNIDGLEDKENLCIDLKKGKGTKTRFTKKIQKLERPQEVIDTDFDGGCEVVQLHGELIKLRCRVCSIEAEWTEEDTEIFLEGAAPECEHCAAKSDQRQAKGKRCLAVGELRPNIVLYGEEHPQNALITPLLPFDIASSPDILIIMGTSLKVHGLQKIIRNFAKAVHERRNGKVIFVNRTRPAESVWEGIIDDWIAMDCDDWVRDLKRRKAELWLPQGDPKLLGLKANAQKRKQRPEDDFNGPGLKRQKLHKVISVDIPQLVSRKTVSKQSKVQRGEKTQFVLSSQSVVVNIPPKTSEAEHHQEDIQMHKWDSTPKGRLTRWRSQRFSGYDGQQILSPLAQQRPPASPLRTYFKPQGALETQTEFIPGSPVTPSFSPMPFSTATPTGWSVHEDLTIATPSPHANMRSQQRASRYASVTNCSAVHDPAWLYESINNTRASENDGTAKPKQHVSAGSDLNDGQPQEWSGRSARDLIKRLWQARF